MRSNFDLLATKFSECNKSDRAILDFYHNHANELETLDSFESEEELYLAVIINFTCGRVLISQTENHSKGKAWLNRARLLVQQNKGRFEINLQDNDWYIQILQSLLKEAIQRIKLFTAAGILDELISIDQNNHNEYRLQKLEIRRGIYYVCSKYSLYLGLTLLTISLLLKAVLTNPTDLIRWMGTAFSIVGLFGLYFNKNTHVK
jgi:hypothetical protein